MVVDTKKFFKDKMIIYSDGGCKPNPGKMYGSYKVAGQSPTNIDLGDGTNNRAELLTLIAAMGYAQTHNLKNVTFLTDSSWVVCEANKLYQCKNIDLVPLVKIINNIMALRADFKVEWVARNVIFDELGH